MELHDYRLGYRGDVEGLRAVAILLVVSAHAGVPWLAGGFVGVDVFFVISGFLITGLLVRETERLGRIDFLDFYARRLRRLLPALVAMLLICGALSSLILAPFEQLPQASACATAALWLSNMHFAFDQLNYFDAISETNLFLHTWSLGVEEQFYLVWPVIILWLLTGGEVASQNIRLQVGMFVIIAASFIASIMLLHQKPLLAFYMMPLRGWQFAIGAVVWLSTRGDASARLRGSVSSVLVACVGWVGFAMICGAALLLTPSQAYPGAAALLPAVGAACVIATGAPGKVLGVSRMLSWRPLQAIGRLSYSWYLWHWPTLLLGHALTGMDTPWYRATYVSISLVMAFASLKFIETPARSNRWVINRRGVAIASAVLVMCAVNVLCIRWYSTAFEWARGAGQQRYAAAAADAPIIYRMGCDNWYFSERVMQCTFGPQDALHTAVLVGDSIAAQWVPAVVQAFSQPGWRVVVFTKSSCPMVNVKLFYARIGREFTECATWRSRVIQEIAAIKPDIVLMSTSGRYGFSDKQWEEGSESVVGLLSKSATHMYVLRSTPLLPFSAPACLAEQEWRPTWLNVFKPCMSTSNDMSSNSVNDAVTRVVHRYPNVTAVDMSEVICPGGVCSAEQHGMIVFRDDQHMTANFSKSIAYELYDRLNVANVISQSAKHLPGDPLGPNQPR